MCGIEFAKLGEISVSNISREFEARGVRELGGFRISSSGFISGLGILEGRQNLQKEGHSVRFCAIKEGQYERNFIMKIHSAQTRPVKKLLV